jgi:hypothetical protein
LERLNEGFIVGEAIGGPDARATDWRYVEDSALGPVGRRRFRIRRRPDHPRGLSRHRRSRKTSRWLFASCGEVAPDELACFKSQKKPVATDMTLELRPHPVQGSPNSPDKKELPR